MEKIRPASRKVAYSLLISTINFVFFFRGIVSLMLLNSHARVLSTAKGGGPAAPIYVFACLFLTLYLLTYFASSSF